MRTGSPRSRSESLQTMQNGTTCFPTLCPSPRIPRVVASTPCPRCWLQERGSAGGAAPEKGPFHAASAGAWPGLLPGQLLLLHGRAPFLTDLDSKLHVCCGRIPVQEKPAQQDGPLLVPAQKRSHATTGHQVRAQPRNGTCWRLDRGLPASGAVRSERTSRPPSGVFRFSSPSGPPNPTSRI